MGAAAIRPDRGVTNFGRDKEVTRPPTDNAGYPHSRPGFICYKMPGYRWRTYLQDIGHSRIDQATSWDLGVAIHIVFCTSGCALRTSSIHPKTYPVLQAVILTMPHVIESLRIQPLDAELSKDTKLGAEVLLPTSSKLLDLDALSGNDKETLRKALFDHGVLVIRNQVGLDPTVLVGLAKLFDPAPLDHHSGGAKQVTDPNNILSLNNCSRIPKAPQVTVIGRGRIENHQGLSEINLQHLDHLSFHETPLSSDEVREGFTRPYRWHMDAPLYENLPGIATVLHAIQVPDLPDQRLAFDDEQDLEIAAGATAC